jgi:hypothetical protein
VKYRNAAEVVPEQVLRELQRYAAGQLLYIPAGRRQPWGEGTGARDEYQGRNERIRGEYRARQANIPALCETYCLSDETVRKIIYQKEGIRMGDYYWQTDLVRLRNSRPEDWKLNWKGHEDSQRHFYDDYEQYLPIDGDNWPEIWANYVKANEGSRERILLAVETLDGEYVGGGNLHGIDERNGTLGFLSGPARCAMPSMPRG